MKEIPNFFTKFYTQKPCILTEALYRIGILNYKMNNSLPNNDKTQKL